MSDRQELNMEQAGSVVGGVSRIVNTGVADLKAAIRNSPTKSGKQIASLTNGTMINTVTDELVYDPVAGRNFVEVIFTDANGNQKTGWIASSIVGMKR